MATTATTWGSRIGFILAGAGSAIGLGSIWKFPFWAGINGGHNVLRGDFIRGTFRKAEAAQNYIG